MKEQEPIWLMDMHRASNKPGVILAGQNGPGATNLVTGIAQAKAAFSPVIALLLVHIQQKIKWKMLSRSRSTIFI